MKRYIPLILIVIQSCARATGQNYFHVDPWARDSLSTPHPNAAQYFKIVMSDKPRGMFVCYDLPLQLGCYKGIDTIKAIENLLSFEGDTRPCVLEIKKYNSRTSYYWDRPDKDYSIQLEALFMINQICLPEPFAYSPIPALVDTQTRSAQTIDGALVKEAYRAYSNWLNLIKQSSLEEVLSQKIMPLDHSGVRWF
jgi:hypothetical protein